MAIGATNASVVRVFTASDSNNITLYKLDKTLKIENNIANLELKNTTAENGNEEAETEIIFKDHDDAKLA